MSNTSQVPDEWLHILCDHFGVIGDRGPTGLTAYGRLAILMRDRFGVNIYAHIPMSPQETRLYGKGYLQLNDTQYDRHDALMRMNMSDWPDALKAYIQAQPGPFSGDALAVWVAEYIKQDPG